VHGSKAAGAPFNVYLRNLNEAGEGGFRAATYAVTAGDTLHQQFPLSLFAGSKYSIEVHAPNGFYRSFTGASDSQHVPIQTECEKKGSMLTGNMLIHLHNAGPEKLTATVADNSYGTGTESKIISPGQTASVVLRLKDSHGWYDFTVKVDKSDAEARFAGRVETGQPSQSDPLIAGTV
jgi:phospholipase C